jgi:hypothetical protein
MIQKNNHNNKKYNLLVICLIIGCFFVNNINNNVLGMESQSALTALTEGQRTNLINKIIYRMSVNKLAKNNLRAHLEQLLKDKLDSLDLLKSADQYILFPMINNRTICPHDISAKGYPEGTTMTLSCIYNFIFTNRLINDEIFKSENTNAFLNAKKIDFKKNFYLVKVVQDKQWKIQLRYKQNNQEQIINIEHDDVRAELEDVWTKLTSEINVYSDNMQYVNPFAVKEEIIQLFNQNIHNDGLSDDTLKAYVERKMNNKDWFNNSKNNLIDKDSNVLLFPTRWNEVDDSWIPCDPNNIEEREVMVFQEIDNSQLLVFEFWHSILTSEHPLVMAIKNRIQAMANDIAPIQSVFLIQNLINSKLETSLQFGQQFIELSPEEVNVILQISNRKIVNFDKDNITDVNPANLEKLLEFFTTEIQKELPERFNVSAYRLTTTELTTLIQENIDYHNFLINDKKDIVNAAKKTLLLPIVSIAGKEVIYNGDPRIKEIVLKTMWHDNENNICIVTTDFYNPIMNSNNQSLKNIQDEIKKTFPNNEDISKRIELQIELNNAIVTEVHLYLYNNGERVKHIKICLELLNTILNATNHEIFDVYKSWNLYNKIDDMLVEKMEAHKMAWDLQEKENEAAREARGEIEDELYLDLAMKESLKDAERRKQQEDAEIEAQIRRIEALSKIENEIQEAQEEAEYHDQIRAVEEPINIEALKDNKKQDIKQEIEQEKIAQLANKRVKEKKKDYRSVGNVYEEFQEPNHVLPIHEGHKVEDINLNYEDISNSMKEQDPEKSYILWIGIMIGISLTLTATAWVHKESTKQNKKADDQNHSNNKFNPPAIEAN